MQIQEKHIAPCGINCTLCFAFQAQAYDLKKKGFNRKYCPGCIPRGEHCTHMGEKCERLKNGSLRFCFMCDDFPCKRLKTLDKRYRTKYHLSAIDNLKDIKDYGIASFLAKQKDVWACPTCDGLICCHTGLCLNCELDVLKENRRYRWGEEIT